MKICLIGVGRTGKEIAKVLLSLKDIELVMAVCRKGSEKLGKDLGEILGIRDTGIIADSCNTLEKNIKLFRPDVAIDFSSPEATLKNASVLGKHNIKMVIGTTGFTDSQLGMLISIQKSNRMGMVYAPNITLGVNVLMVISNLAASILENYDCEIIESHFKNKKDAPSGTAKKIADEVQKGKSISAGIGYHSHIEEDVPIHSVRAGGLIGRHRLIFAGEHDKVEIIHESFSRTAFALGAIKAVSFIHCRTGFFEMNDVFDLKHVINEYLAREEKLKKRRHLNISINDEKRSV